MCLCFTICSCFLLQSEILTTPSSSSLNLNVLSGFLWAAAAVQKGKKQGVPGSEEDADSVVHITNPSAAPKAWALDLLLSWIYDYFIDSVFTLIYSDLLSHRDWSLSQKQKLPTQQPGSFMEPQLSLILSLDIFHSGAAEELLINQISLELLLESWVSAIFYLSCDSNTLSLNLV